MVFISMFLLSICQAAPPSGQDVTKLFSAGSAVVDITPPPGLPMWGYGARHALPATGVHDPLYASAVVFQVGDEKLAVVGLDLGRSPARKTLAAIRRNVRDRAGVSHIMLVGSHTHHGPCLELEDLPPTSDYIRELTEKLSTVIVEAAKSARPARLGLARAEVDFNRNRHTKIEPRPVDRDLIVMRIDDMGGKPIACIVNFAAHPTTRPGDMLQYSADFPGPMRKQIEQFVGGHCIYLQGACGDLSTDRKGMSTDEYGVALGNRVAEMFRTIQTRPPSNPSIKVREQEFTFDSRTDLKDQATYTLFVVAFFKELVDTFVEEYRGGVRPTLTVALLNDSIGLVGASGEFFCSHAIRLKQRSRLEHTLFLGYCNGYHQYFPTIEAAAEGGYGADPSVSPVEVGAGETMMDRALFHLYDMRRDYPGLKKSTIEKD